MQQGDGGGCALGTPRHRRCPLLSCAGANGTGLQLPDLKGTNPAHLKPWATVPLLPTEPGTRRGCCHREMHPLKSDLPAGSAYLFPSGSTDPIHCHQHCPVRPARVLLLCLRWSWASAWASLLKQRKKAGIWTGGQHKSQVWVTLRVSSSAWIGFVTSSSSSILYAFNLRMIFSYIALDLGSFPHCPDGSGSRPTGFVSCPAWGHRWASVQPDTLLCHHPFGTDSWPDSTIRAGADAQAEVPFVVSYHCRFQCSQRPKMLWARYFVSLLAKDSQSSEVPVPRPLLPEEASPQLNTISQNRASLSSYRFPPTRAELIRQLFPSSGSRYRINSLGE